MFNAALHGKVHDTGVWVDRQQLKNCRNAIRVRFSEGYSMSFRMIIGSSFVQFRRKLVRSWLRRVCWM